MRPGRARRPADLDRRGERADAAHRRRRGRRRRRPSDRHAPLASRGHLADAARRRSRGRTPEPAPAGWCPTCMTSINRDRAQALQDAKQQIGFYYTVKVYHTILQHSRPAGGRGGCRAALPTSMSPRWPPRFPDALVDEIAIAGTPDEARDRLAQWHDLVRRGAVLCAVGRRPAGAGAREQSTRFSTCSARPR